MPYIQVQLEISPAQQKQALKGARIKLTPDAIGKGRIVMLHPLNAKKVATRKGGVMLELSPGEIMTTASYHEMMPNVPEGVSGSGFLDNAWQLLKKGGKWLKDTGIASAIADVAQDAATPFIGETGSKIARDVLRSTTGVGLKMKGKGMRNMAKGSGLYL